MFSQDTGIMRNFMAFNRQEKLISSDPLNWLGVIIGFIDSVTGYGVYTIYGVIYSEIGSARSMQIKRKHVIEMYSMDFIVFLIC